MLERWGLRRLRPSRWSGACIGAWSMRAPARGGGGVARVLAQCITEGWHGFQKLRIGKGLVAHVAIVTQSRTQSAPGYLPRSMPACCTISVRYPCDIRISVRYPCDIRTISTRTDIAISAHVRAHIHRTSTAHPPHIHPHIHRTSTRSSNAHPDSRMCGTPPSEPSMEPRSLRKLATAQASALPHAHAATRLTGGRSGACSSRCVVQPNNRLLPVPAVCRLATFDCAHAKARWRLPRPQWSRDSRQVGEMVRLHRVMNASAQRRASLDHRRHSASICHRDTLAPVRQ